MRHDVLIGVAVAAAFVGIASAVERVPPEYDAKIFRVSLADPDPFARARACIAGWKAEHGGRLPRGGVIVEFADGVYRLDRTWRLSAADSGTPDCPILYRAQHVGKVVFSGAVELDWQPMDRATGLPPSAALIPADARPHVLTATLPPDAEAPGFFGASCYMQDELLDDPAYAYPYALYQDGRRLDGARWPKAGFAEVTELTGNITTNWAGVNGSGSSFGGRGPAGEPLPLADWMREPDLYLHGEWQLEYVDCATKPTAFDAEAGRITCDRRHVQRGFRLQAPFLAFNALSSLEDEGEWAFDVGARRLYVRPLQGTSRPVLARTKTLLLAENVTDVEFEGFVFEAVRGPAIRFVACRDIVLRTACVRGTTGWGVRVEGGKNARIEGCDLYDLGEGGVWLEGGTIDTLTHSGHVCDNCRIHDYAKLVWCYNPGVELLGCGAEATHNLVYSAPHQACFFYGAEHRFAWNVVHDVCRFSDDSGAIYTYNTHNAWSHRGNVIEHNVFHAMNPAPERRKVSTQLDGIYLDAFTSGTVVRGNIVSEASHPIFLSGGQDTLVEGNVVVRGRSEALRRWNLGLMAGTNRFHHVIWGKTNDCDRASYLMKPLLDKRDLYEMSFWKDRYPKMLAPLDFEDPALGHCSHFCRIRNNVFVASRPMRIVDEKETAATTEIRDNAVFEGDPGFVDFSGLNWELRPDAPARKTLGGRLRFAEMGLYESPRRFSRPTRFGPCVTRPKPLN